MGPLEEPAAPSGLAGDRGRPGEVARAAGEAALAGRIGRAGDRDGARVAGKELVDEIVERLEERGVPSGAWLLEIARVRRSLQEADAVLRRLEDAITRAATEAPPGGS